MGWCHSGTGTDGGFKLDDAAFQEGLSSNRSGLVQRGKSQHWGALAKELKFAEAAGDDDEDQRRKAKKGKAQMWGELAEEMQFSEKRNQDSMKSMWSDVARDLNVAEDDPSFSKLTPEKLTMLAENQARRIEQRRADQAKRIEARRSLE